MNDPNDLLREIRGILVDEQTDSFSLVGFNRQGASNGECITLSLDFVGNITPENRAHICASLIEQQAEATELDAPEFIEKVVQSHNTLTGYTEEL